MDNEGWKLVESYINNQVQSTTNELCSKKFDSMEEVARRQERLAVWREFWGFIEDKIRRKNKEIHRETPPTG